MVIGNTYTFSWYDIEDATLHLSRDGGTTWELLAANVLTALGETMIGSYTWTITGPASNNCVIRVTDNGDASTLLGVTFSISAAGGAAILSGNRLAISIAIGI